jgi:hypothetical protein
MQNRDLILVLAILERAKLSKSERFLFSFAATALGIFLLKIFINN